MTYRERRERKAANYREWADKRQSAATATIRRISDTFHEDIALLTQPGHIPQRARMIAQEDRAFESLRKAESMDSRAETIESQLDASIYDDDPDAVERVRERIAGLEAERERYKAHNKAMRKPDACQHPADCDCRSYFPRSCDCKQHPLPGYVLANLGGNISRQRERLARLESAAIAKAKVAAAAEQGREWTVSNTSWPGYVEVAFADKPERDILDELKAAGFRWNRTRASWQGERDRLPARYKEQAA